MEFEDVVLHLLTSEYVRTPAGVSAKNINHVANSDLQNSSQHKSLDFWS